ncbi:thiopurine S-methyltransferase [Rheinheimera texasensis]|uniref:thiopurine S-methyltransferase n=1 Tax=Rheinheimera texasensis TaxID=306205 RepID=UPI0032B1133D
MQQDFWLQCWQQNQLGWQQDEAHPLLRSAPSDWLNASPVFVPLCGKSPDLLFLAQQAPVVGAELSEIACRDFFTENQLQATRAEAGEFVCYSAAEIKLWQGDFFAMQSAQVAECRRIYDRAALIALPAPMRRDYVNQLRALMPTADLLLLSLEYPVGEKNGPPFSVPAEEITRLFGFAEVTLLQQRDLTGQGFARRRFDTTYLTETSWRIRW